MLYPLYVWKDTNSAYGASFPDLPGVFTAADELENLPAMAQDAVECMYEGEQEVPNATSIDRWRNHPDYKDGFWMMVDIDLSKVNVKPIRLNISLPENLVHEIDRYAKEHHLTRSGFLAKAAVMAMNDKHS